MIEVIENCINMETVNIKHCKSVTYNLQSLYLSLINMKPL